MSFRNNQSCRFFLLQVVDPRDRSAAIYEMKELTQLVHTLGGKVVGKETQHKNHPDPGTYIGSGKVEWLQQQVKVHRIDVVVLNDVVKSSQLFHLEKELWSINKNIQVWDKVDLILHIFDQHAQTTEAKLQIELARIQHGGPRIYGLGGTVLSRQGGGIGTRGIGETNIEIERRHMGKRVQTIKKELKKRMRQQRNRISKRGQKGVYTAALVGYTSAGKTSLFNKLTSKNKKIDSQLFTTLDSVVGKIKFNRTPPLLLSDTIGFIQNLPPDLVQAFSSTLQESLKARILLHVVDVSDKNWFEKLKVVEEILQEIRLNSGENQRTAADPILLFNKIDLLSQKEQQALMSYAPDRQRFLVSAKTGAGINELKAFLKHRSQPADRATSN